MVVKDKILMLSDYNRYSNQDALPWLEQNYSWDADNEQWKTLNTIKTELKPDYDFAINIVIDEVEKESRSIVNLNYQLDEIKEVKLIDGDIYLQILLDKKLIDSEIKSDKVNLRLKNVYISLANYEYGINHQYLFANNGWFFINNVLTTKIKTYIPINTQGENEVIMFSREQDNMIKVLTNQPYLDNYRFSDAYAIYSLAGKNQPEFIYESLHDYLMKGSLKRQITGINFNLGHGDDVAVGLIAVKNRFLSYNGHKIFIGGEQDDVFILSSEMLGATEYKYFNGDKGNDTLIIAQLPRYYSNVLLSSDGILSDNVTLSLTRTFINLEQG